MLRRISLLQLECNKKLVVKFCNALSAQHWQEILSLLDLAQVFFDGSLEKRPYFGLWEVDKLLKIKA